MKLGKAVAGSKGPLTAGGSPRLRKVMASFVTAWLELLAEASFASDLKVAL